MKIKKINLFYFYLLILSLLLFLVIYSCTIEDIIGIQPPIFLPKEGAYESEIFVEIVTFAKGAKIRYTLDNSEPSEINGIIYNGKFKLDKSCVVKAVAYKDDYSVSEVKVANYIILNNNSTDNTNTVKPPVFSPTEGTYESSIYVEISTPTENATIRYTLDNSEPSETKGIIYNGKFKLDKSTVVKAIAYKEGYKSSEIKTANYIIKGNNNSSIDNPKMLTENIWTEDRVNSGEVDWFCFYAYKSIPYEIRWEDYDWGYGKYDSDIVVTIYKSDKTSIYHNKVDSGLRYPVLIVPQENGYVYLKVEPVKSSTSGPYAIKYNKLNPINLIEDRWQEDIFGNDKLYVKWFTFDAIKGEIYEIKWDDSSNYGSAYKAYIYVSVYSEDFSITYLNNETEGYEKPKYILVNSSGKIYLKASCFSNGGNFAIKYKKYDNNNDNGNVTVNTSIVNPYNNVYNNFDFSFKPNERWTFMIYLDADNNLENEGIKAFFQLLNGLNGLNKPNIKVIVLMDRISGNSYSTSIDGKDWTDTRLYAINQDNTYTRLDGSYYGLPSNSGSLEMNMGDPMTLSKFIDFCKSEYYADHYALILWNHGGGAKSISNQKVNSGTTRAICWDDTNSSDCLFLDELQQALKAHYNNFNKLDFIGFEACLMATVEVAYELRNLAKVMAANMTPIYGWNLSAIFKEMSGSGSDDPAELGKLVVWAFKNFAPNYSYGLTQSAVNLESMEDLKILIDRLAVALYRDNKKEAIEKIRDATIHMYEDDYESIVYPYYDLNDFCVKIIGNQNVFSYEVVQIANDIIEKLGEIVIAACSGSYSRSYYGLGSYVKRGLSIFISRGNLKYNNYSHYAYQWWYSNTDFSAYQTTKKGYGNIDFADCNRNGIVETWKELFEVWYDPQNKLTSDTY